MTGLPADGATAGSPPILSRRTMIYGLVAVLIASAALSLRVLETDPQVQQGQETLTTIYTPPRSRAQAMLNEHDGQHFAALAMDPAMERPEIFGGPPERAYRAARPLFGWLGWAASAGQGSAVEWVLIVLSALSAGALVLGAGMLADQLSRSPTWLLAVLALPGAVVQMAWAGVGDNLAAGLTSGGLALWFAGRRRAAVVMLTLAMLTRETCAIVPLAIAFGEVIERRPWRRVLPLLIPFGTYALWVAIVRARVGAWPTSASGGRLAPPWSGFWVGVQDWDVADALFLVVGVVLVGVAVTRRPGPALMSMFALYAGLALVMGWNVWVRWEDFSRVLLPVYVAAFVVVLPSVGAARTTSSQPQLT